MASSRIQSPPGVNRSKFDWLACRSGADQHSLYVSTRRVGECDLYAERHSALGGGIPTPIACFSKQINSPKVIDLALLNSVTQVIVTKKQIGLYVASMPADARVQLIQHYKLALVLAVQKSPRSEFEEIDCELKNIFLHEIDKLQRELDPQPKGARSRLHRSPANSDRCRL